MIEKAWGVSAELFRDALTMVHEIRVRPGGRSSRHFHRHMTNLFKVEIGTLEVQIWFDEQHPETYVLGHESGVLQVPPGFYHQFEAKTDVLAREVYLVAAGGVCDPTDIVRATE